MAFVVNSQNFETEVLQSNIPVLVDFFATWCGPCKMIAPTIDQLSTEFSGKVKIVKLDVDEARDIAAQYNIMSVPTLMVFKNGEVVDKVLGAQSKSALEAKLNNL